MEQERSIKTDFELIMEAKSLTMPASDHLPIKGTSELALKFFYRNYQKARVTVSLVQACMSMRGIFFTNSARFVFTASSVLCLNALLFLQP